MTDDTPPTAKTTEMPEAEEPYSAERLPTARSAADYQLAALNGAVPPAPAWLERAMAQEPEQRAVEVDGAPIETLIWGEPGKPGLLLMHGSRANADWWRFIAPLLMRDYRVAAFSMSGMGQSGRRARYSVRQFAREAAQVARAADLFAGPDSPIIAAHSFGGYGALQATLDQPGRFGGVILIDSIMRNLDGTQPWRRLQPEPLRVYPTLESAIARFRLVPARASEAVWALDAIARASVIHDAALGGWTWRFDNEYFAKLEAEDLSTLREVKAPVAIIRGEESELMDPATRAHVAAAFGDDIPDIVIPDAGHHIMAEQPLALAAALRSLLAAWPDDRKPRRSILGTTEPAPY